MNKLTPLTSVSPIDGRYHNKTQKLSEFFSEFALIKYRVYVEVKYLIELNNAINLNIPNANDLMSIYYDFSEADAHEIKEIEKKDQSRCKSSRVFYQNQIRKT